MGLVHYILYKEDRHGGSSVMMMDMTQEEIDKALEDWKAGLMAEVDKKIAAMADSRPTNAELSAELDKMGAKLREVEQRAESLNKTQEKSKVFS